MIEKKQEDAFMEDLLVFRDEKRSKPIRDAAFDRVKRFASEVAPNIVLTDMGVDIPVTEQFTPKVRRESPPQAKLDIFQGKERVVGGMCVTARVEKDIPPLFFRNADRLVVNSKVLRDRFDWIRGRQ